MADDVGRRRSALWWRPVLDRMLPRTGERAQRLSFAAILAGTVLIGALVDVVGPAYVPPTLLLLPILAGGLLLGLRRLRVVDVVVAGAFAYDFARLGWREVRVGTFVVAVATAFLAAELAHTRELLGVSSTRSEHMLLELRDTLLRHGDLPRLPAGWHAEVVQRSAGGGRFGGDFFVSARTDGGRLLEVALVDVSGKGVDAGTRALQLSGAFGGLLGAVPPAQFLTAANAYLLRQEWTEGFATAVHLTVDLDTGWYRVASAGHPPAARLSGGSGRWELSDASGPLLGVLADAEFRAEEGTLGSFDAVLLYSDGLVEVPGRDLEVGIDRLLGGAERLVPRGFTGRAEELVDAVAPRASDDRALLILWRT